MIEKRDAVLVLTVSFVLYYSFHWMRCLVENPSICSAEDRLYLSSLVEHSSEVVAPTAVCGTVFYVSVRYALYLSELRAVSYRLQVYTTAYLNVAILLILVSLCVPSIEDPYYLYLHVLPVQSGMLLLCFWLAAYVWLHGTTDEVAFFLIAVISMVAAGLGAWGWVHTSKWYSIVTQSVGLFAVYTNSLFMIARS